MASVGTETIARHIAARIRTRSEIFLGLNVVLADDIAILSPAASGLDDNAVIDDGVSTPIPFTGKRFKDFLALIQLVHTAGQDAMDAFRASQVRAIDLLVAAIGSVESALPNPASAMLQSRIRPRARLLRALRYLINDDVRYLSQIIEPAWDDNDTLNEGRTDSTLPLTIATVRMVLAFEQAILASNALSDPSALAIEAACPTILEVT